MNQRVDVERCPSRAALLCAIEGELSAKERVPLLSHLCRCERCRRDVDEISCYTELIAVSIDRSVDLDGVKARTERFICLLHNHKQALVGTPPNWRMRRWLPFAAVIPMLVVGCLLTYTQDVVRADELLARAAAYAQARPAGWAQHVQIRVVPAATARASSSTARLMAFDSLAARCNANDHSRSLATLLAAHHLDLREPLSVERLNAWRASLARRTERMSVSREVTTLLITTEDGALTEARLSIRRDTFQVVGLDLAFEGLGRVTFQDIADKQTGTREQACSMSSG